MLRGANPVADAKIQYTMTNVPRVFITHLRSVSLASGFNWLLYVASRVALQSLLAYQTQGLRVQTNALTRNDTRSSV